VAQEATTAKERRSAAGTEIGRPGLVNVGGGLLPWSVWIDDREYAPDLQYPKSIDTYRRMQTDAQVKGLLLATTLPIRRFRWEIDPNEARPEVVAHVCRSLNLPEVGAEPPRRRRNRFDFDRHMAHAFQALVYGHYHFEEVYEYADPRQGGDGLVHLAKLGTRPPRTIMNIATDEYGELEGIQQNMFVRTNPSAVGQAGAAFGPLIPVDRLLTYLWDTEDDGDQVGRSMLRACYKNWLVKDALVRVDATKHQRNAMGVPWFEVDANANEKQVKELAKVAEEWRAGEASGGAGPGKLYLKGVDGTLPDTIASVRYHDQQMSRAFLQLFFDLGTTETGSRALGAELIDWYTQSQDGVAGWFCNTTQLQIEREVELNWGPDEQPPLLVHQRMESQELAFADLVAGVESGLIAVDEELGSYIEQRWHLPRGTGATEPKPEPSPAALPSGEPGVVPNPGEEPVPKAPNPDARQRRRAELASRIEAAVTEPMRWPDVARAAGVDPKHGTARRARDQLVRANRLQRRGDGTLAPVAGMRLPDRELRREPSEVEMAAHVDFAAMEETHVSAVDALVEAVRAAQQAQFDEIAEEVEAAAGDASRLADIHVEPIPVDLLEEHLLEVAEAGVASARAERDAQLAPEGEGQPAAAGTEDPVPDQEAIDRIVAERAEATARTLAGGLSAAASKRAAALSALPPAEAAANVRGYLEGLKGVAMEEQVGGAVTQAYNTGRREFMRAADPKEVYASEILDANTCEPCAEEDGESWPSIAAAEAAYPIGGYIDCEGGLKCRGTVIAVYV